MPELPEVETTRIGLAPYLLGETVKEVIVRERRLRWPIPKQLDKDLPGNEIRKVKRRGKYILIYTESGCMILHLGMSGRAYILLEDKAVEKHDHIDIVFNSGTRLRFTDPRRFGSLHWTKRDPLKHKLLASLGPEPLSDEFTADYLYEVSRGRSQMIKTFIMDSHIVVGVGNIYASEALFRAGIMPTRKAGKISRPRYALLVQEIQNVLREAIEQGGTTLRDFLNGDGKPGYFAQKLNVYDREGERCPKCTATIKQKRIGQRSSYYCSKCQK